jgi:hypothetical protein
MTDITPTEYALAFARNLVLEVEQSHGNAFAQRIAMKIALSNDRNAVIHALPHALLHADTDTVDFFSDALEIFPWFGHVNLDTKIRALKKRTTGGKN